MRSATIEVLDAGEKVRLVGRFGTDSDGYRFLLAAGRRWPERVWAVEGCERVGRHLAQRLVADGEPVVDVPAKLSARARVFSTGQGRPGGISGGGVGGDAHDVLQLVARNAILVRDHGERLPGPEQGQGVLEPCPASREDRLSEAPSRIDDDVGHLIPREPDQRHVAVVGEAEPPQVGVDHLAEHMLAVATTTSSLAAVAAPESSPCLE